MARLCVGVTWLAATVPALLGGCKNGDDGASAGFAGEALDSTDVVGSEAGLLATFVDDVDENGTAEAAASFAVARAASTWTPSGCATATPTGATVSYVLADCTGPFGLVHVSGTVTVIYGLVPGGGISADATASDLAVNGASYDLSVHAEYSTSGSVRQIVVTTSGAGTGPRGTMFSRSGNYTLSWDEGALCTKLDGVWTTSIGARSWTTTVAQLTRCMGGCPASGAQVSYAGGVAGVTLTVEFDGSDHAAWSSSRGAHGTIDLLCK